MTFVMSMAKAFTLWGALTVGEPTLCPNQLGDSRSDEELNCEVVAMVAGPGGSFDGVVILREVQ